MNTTMFPDWLRIILSLLTIASFIPQFHLIWARKNADGISLLYVFYSLVAATEQFALNFGFIALIEPTNDKVFVHNPRTVGDWLNFAQTLIFMALFLVFFILALWFPSKGSTPTQKRLILGTYTVYVLGAVVPLFACAIINSINDDQSAWRKLPMVLTFAPHMMGLNYAATTAVMLGTYYQILVLEKEEEEEKEPAAPSILSTIYDDDHDDHDHPALPSPRGEQEDEDDDKTTLHASFRANGSLSLGGLAVQCVLSIGLGISWIFRVSFLPLPHGVHWWASSYVVEVWYELVGSIAVDNALFGIGQGVLLYLAVKRQRVNCVVEGEGEGADADEEELTGERELLLRSI
ncbi:hypothetical protein BJX64DRAFT_265232 [Aspergillus heterothallicus]